MNVRTGNLKTGHGKIGLGSISLFLLLLLGAVLSTACSGSAEASLDPASLEAEQRILSDMGLLPVQGRPRAVGFDLPVPNTDTTADSLGLEDFRGKYVVLNFWATWCFPCREEMPSLDRLSAEQEPFGDLVVLALSSRESVDTVQTFLRDYDYRFPIAVDVEGEISTKYGVRGLPTTYLISPDGRVIGGKAGAFEWDSADIQSGLAALRQLHS